MRMQWGAELQQQIEAERMKDQKRDQELDAQDAYAEAQASGDPERMRLASEALDQASNAYEYAILDHHDTICNAREARHARIVAEHVERRTA